MISFWYQKFVYRFAFLVGLLGFVGVIGYAFLTDAMNPPRESDVAPFEETIQPVASNQLFATGSDAPLSKPHVNSKEIQNWLNTSVSEALTFKGRDLNRVLKQVRPYFTVNGFEQYKEYLQTAAIDKTIESGQYKIGIFFDQNPYVGRGFEYEDVYRWQATMPVSLSIKSLRTGQISNRKVDLNLQVKRVVKSASENGIKIDVWQVKASR